eukprot:Tbor_TRINITY_DN5501_c7_g1::TRINITY_DN5501_c7_g1_i1::g.13552::m.13552
MLRHTILDLHRGGRSRGFIHKDPTLNYAKSTLGTRNMGRMGTLPRSKLGFARTGFYGQSQYDHAFPLLSHDDLGHSDQSNDTHHVQLANYMPKRNKGTAPWFRGADTYSAKYSEQGRYEYQRYLMISRFPVSYKREFVRFLHCIKMSSGEYALPQEAIHWLQRMIVDNFNPQHAHYIAAMETLMRSEELLMARDAWKIMERQQTWPCDKTIRTYLELCIRAKEKTWAFECWNRYCTEKKFLEAGETDPKPVSRVPFTLNRDELIYLPKWKKFFDHDPNMDVIDLNRFNTTRDIYAKMAQVMLVSNDISMFNQFFQELEDKLLSTPTPVPEPPNPLFTPIPRWSPYLAASTLKAGAWRLENTNSVQALGPSVTSIPQLSARFYSNEQFLVHTIGECIGLLAAAKHADMTSDEAVRMAEELYGRLKNKLGAKSFAQLQTEALFVAILQVFRIHKGEGGKQLYERAQMLMRDKASGARDGLIETLQASIYLEILRGFTTESADKNSPSFKPKETMKHLTEILQVMAADVHITWAADMHLEIIRTLVNTGTMVANKYFITNVLRKFSWESEFLEALYIEYRRADDVDTWAELTKRALVWTARYDVEVSENLKNMIEDDYATIKVQVRSFRELAVFQFRNVEEERVARDPVSLLPNPWTDYVSHALPFPDRDTGYPNEYGEIGQWRAPAGVTKGPGYYAPSMYGETLKQYTSEWRDPKNPMTPPAFPNPWERKYQQYARGQHPSYDMTYAGPMPEIFPQRKVFRQKTRWDTHDIQKQSKHKIMGPY